MFEIDLSDKGQFNLLALIAIIFSSVIVSAVVLNETVSDSNDANTPALPDALANEIAEQVINESAGDRLALNEEIIKDYESEAVDEDLEGVTGAVVGENEENGNQTVEVDETVTISEISEDITNLTLPLENAAIPEVNVTDNLNVLVDTNISEEIIVVNATNETRIDVPINLSQLQINITNKTKAVLAEVVNGQSIHTPKIQEYIRWYNNFSSLKFKNIENKTQVSTAMKVGNFNHELKGFTINNSKYAFELLACDKRTKGCSFRVNGVSTGKIYPSEIGETPHSFSLNDEYEIEIDSVIFNYCDNKHFCDTHFEAYDLVNVSIRRTR